MGKMRILNQSGDETLTWNPEDATEVEKARAEFERLKGEGYEFYSSVQTKGRKVARFSADLGSLIAAPGGRSARDKETGKRSGAMAGGPLAERG